MMNSNQKKVEKVHDLANFSASQKIRHCFEWWGECGVVVKLPLHTPQKNYRTLNSKKISLGSK